MHKVESFVIGGRRLDLLVDDRIPRDEIHMVVRRAVGRGPDGGLVFTTYTQPIVEGISHEIEEEG